MNATIDIPWAAWPFGAMSPMTVNRKVNATAYSRQSPSASSPAVMPQVVNVGQRSNLYRTINRLEAAGLISVRHTERDQQFPERTVYELTDAGRQASRDWLTDMLPAPRYEFPEFPAALSFAMVLGPDETLAVLERRADGVRARLAELTWLTSVLDDLRSGSLARSAEDFDPAKYELPGVDL